MAWYSVSWQIHHAASFSQLAKQKRKMGRKKRKDKKQVEPLQNDEHQPASQGRLAPQQVRRRFRAASWSANSKAIQTRSADRTNTRQSHSADGAQADTDPLCPSWTWLPDVHRAKGRGRGPRRKIGRESGRRRRETNKQGHKTRTIERNRSTQRAQKQRKKNPKSSPPDNGSDSLDSVCLGPSRCRLVGQPLGICFLAE